MYKQVLTNTKLKIGKRGKKTELSGKSALGGRGAHWGAVGPVKEKKKKVKKKDKKKKR